MIFENKNVHYPRTVRFGRSGLLSKKTQYKKYKQSGRSMIEMLGVLAIVGVLSAGGIAGYSMAMQSYKTTQLIEKIQLIATRARTVYKSDYTGITIDNLLNSGKLSESDVQNPFGGGFTMAKSGWATNGFYVKTETPLPAEVCTDMLQTDWGNTGVFEGVHLEGANPVTVRYSTSSWPVSLTNAINYCKSGTTEFEIHFK